MQVQKKSGDKKMYCGPPKTEIGRLFNCHPSEGVQTYFDGDRIFFSLNARTAIRKTCDVLGIRPGDEVLAPAYNCGSEIDPILKAGARVRLYPVDKSTNIDPSEVEKRISTRTRVLYVTHYFGFCQPAIKELKDICIKRNIFLIEDCALALFSRTDDNRIGSYGDVAIFCFYKFLPVIGGGAMVVNNRQLSASPHPFIKRPPAFFTAKEMARWLLPSSFRTSLRALFRSPRKPIQDPGNEFPDIPDHYYFDPAFIDARMNWVTKHLLNTYDPSDIIARRRANFLTYLREFEGIDAAQPLFRWLPTGVCPLAFPIIVADRNVICEKLGALSIEATPWWSGYHKELDWSGHSEAQNLKNSVITLPLHQGLDDPHIVHIARELRNLLSQARSPVH